MTTRPSGPRSDQQRTRQVLINIDVDDLEAGVRFYADGLGLRQGRRLFGGSVVEMVGAPVPIYLIEKQPGTLPSPRAAGLRDYRRHWTPVHLDFPVDELEAALERALVAGARLEGEVVAFPWGTLATMSDPFGHGFCLLQFSGDGYDNAVHRVT
jgi:predicted enzyme related to lactoylglutathione lyase